MYLKRPYCVCGFKSAAGVWPECVLVKCSKLKVDVDILYMGGGGIVLF